MAKQKEKIKNNSEFVCGSFEKSYTDKSNQALSYIRKTVGGEQVVGLNFNLDEAAFYCVRSSVNMRCISVVAACVAGLGYEFDDEQNAKDSGVFDFLDKLYDRFGSPTPFSTLLSNWITDEGIFGTSRLEIRRIDGVVQNLHLLSGKNCFVDSNLTKIIQYVILSNTNIMTTIFRNYGEYNSKESDTLLLNNFLPAVDDYYGVPVYLPALQAIKTNVFANDANISTLANISDPNLTAVAYGNYPAEWHEKTKAALKNTKLKRGGLLYISVPNKDDKFDLNVRGQQTIDGNYIEERIKNELEIMACHGLTPELYGVLSNGVISSGEKATGALKIFNQTVVRPKQEILNKKINAFFKNEFPEYTANFKLKEIDLTDKLEDLQTAQIFASVIKSYVEIGNKKLLDEFLKENNYPEISDIEFSNMKTSISGLDMQMPV